MEEDTVMLLTLIAVSILGIVGIWANWIRPNPSLYPDENDQSRENRK